MNATQKVLRIGLVLVAGVVGVLVSVTVLDRGRPDAPVSSPPTAATLAPARTLWTGQDVVDAFPGPDVFPVPVEVFRDPDGPGSVFPSYNCLGEALGAALPSSLGPYVTVDYQSSAVTAAINLSRYSRDKDDRATTVISEAPDACDGDSSAADDRVKSTMHRLDTPPYFAHEALVYQRRSTDPDDSWVTGAEYTAYSNGWFLTVTADQDDADIVLTVVLPALDGALGTAFYRETAGTPDQLRGAPLVAGMVDTGCEPDPELEMPLLELTRPIEWTDVNGDTFVDAILVASCTSRTARNPEFVRIFDGSSPRSSPRLLARLFEDEDLYLRNTSVQVEGQEMVVDAEALSDSAPLCCADLRFTQRFAWNGSTLVSGPRTLMHR